MADWRCDYEVALAYGLRTFSINPSKHRIFNGLAGVYFPPLQLSRKLKLSTLYSIRELGPTKFLIELVFIFIFVGFLKACCFYFVLEQNFLELYGFIQILPPYKWIIHIILGIFKTQA